MKKANGIIIRNEQERTAVEVLTKAHEWMCNEYGVNPVLSFQRKCNWGKDARYAGFHLARENSVTLNFRNMYGATIKDLLSVLGHEIRHAVQYSTGLLSIDKFDRNEYKGRTAMIARTWKGERMRVAYKTAPWEVDAREYQNQYADACIKVLKLKGVSKTKIPYGTKTESDKRATYNKIIAKYNKTDFQLLHVNWVKTKKIGTGDGMVYILKKNLLKDFDFKNTKHIEWLRTKGQKHIKFVPMVKVTTKYGGFSVEEMVS